MKIMATAPKDGTEIMAFHKDGGNYHPVYWEGSRWGMRWNAEYHCSDGFYAGWIPYPMPAGGADAMDK